MRGIIVLEGADAAGKTTLAECLVERYGAKYLHNGIHAQIWRRHVAALRLACRWAEHHLVVVDRLFLSELAYGEVYRGGPAYDVAARCLDRVLLKHGALTVLCAPRDQERQLARHADLRTKRPEAFANIQRVVQLYADLRDGNLAQPGGGYLHQLIRYGDYARRPDVVVYDLDEHPGKHKVRAFAKRLIHRLDDYRSRQFQPALAYQHDNLLGHLERAHYLFVGEEVTPQLHPGFPHWPFFWGEGMSSMTYLNRALQKIGFDETSALWTNAKSPDPHLPDLAAIAATGKLKVIALGRVAERTVAGWAGGNTLVRNVPHPQFVRRFHHRTDYSDILKEALLK